MDQYLAIGRIDTTLPFIKKKGVEVLSRTYPEVGTAQTQIANSLTEYYRTAHSKVWSEDKASVMQAIDRVQDIYRSNIFPEMNVDWRTYPDNIGHLYSPGCFRCHDGKHVNQFGDTISKDCAICHTFLVPAEDDGDLFREGSFIHTWEAPDQHQDLNCFQCHSGSTLDASCEGCHSETHGLRTASLTQFRDLGIEPEPMVDIVDCEFCHDLSERVTLDVVDASCMDCHGGEEEYEGMLGRWAQSLDGAKKRCTEALDSLGDAIGRNKNHAEARLWLQEKRQILAILERANPLHNPDGSTRIYEQITREALEKVDAASGST